MRVDMQILDEFDRIRNMLQRDGWVIKNEQGKEMQLIHAQVRDEAAARNRLCRLGLLTSASLRVEFPIPQTRRES